MNTTIVQKAVVLNDDGHILIVRRSSIDSRRPLQWDLPGGQFEDGEEMIASVEREIREETALEVIDTRAIYAKTELRKWEAGEASAVFVFYVAYAKSSEVKLSFEHDTYQWLALVDAIPLFEYDLHKELLNYIQENDILL